jgi:hypothetical protein
MGRRGSGFGKIAWGPRARARGFDRLTWGLMSGPMSGLISGLVAGCLLWAASAPVRATEAVAESEARAEKPRGAEVDPPGRVGRIVELQGNVSRYDQEENRWSDAERNRPLTGGDRLSTAGGARVELRVGSTVLRLGGGTELEVLRLDDDRLAFQLHSGSLALRVRNREKAAEIEIVTLEARLLPLRAGHYRIDRPNDDTTFAASWRGDLRVDGGGRLTAATGQRLELYRARGGELRHIWRGMQSDTFSAWAQGEDERDERHARSEHVSPEMTGAEDLDRWGQWDRHPDYGAIWYPSTVAVGWAPYRYGRWVWVRPWGWTWMDDARWGFAPFHYGRWVWWRDRWCWAPGAYVARPVYAPALVAWVGGPHVSVSVNVGAPTVGWVPLAPREVYVPHYRVSPVYIDRVNVNPRFVQPGQPHADPRQPQTIPTGPVAYTNQGVPGAVTVVPRDVLVRREPVARAVVSLPAELNRAPVQVVAPPPPVMQVSPAPQRGDGAGGTAGAVPRVGSPVQREGAPPQVQGAQGAQGATPVQIPGAVSTMPRRPEMAGDEGPSRDRRDGREVRPREQREPRDAGEGRDRRDFSGGAVRPVGPTPAAPVTAAPQVQQVPRVISMPAQTQGTPSAPPSTPPQQQRQAPAPAPVVVQQPPPQRVQPAPPQGQRGGADDERKRPVPSPRHGEREREATR